MTITMTEALVAIGNKPVTAHELGVNGGVLKGLWARGLLIADRDGYPPMYTLSPKGRSLSDFLTGDPVLIQHEGALARIQHTTAAYFRIPPIEMTSARRARKVARPRQVAMYLAKQLTPLSLPNLGRRFGNRDHTTIMHGIRVIEDLIDTDATMRRTVTELMGMLGHHDWVPEATDEQRSSDALVGSAMLRDAIMEMAA
jgi:chromosomal replication initiator protein